MINTRLSSLIISVNTVSGGMFSIMMSKEIRFQLGFKLIISVFPKSNTVKMSESETVTLLESVTIRVTIKSVSESTSGDINSVNGSLGSIN